MGEWKLMGSVFLKIVIVAYITILSEFCIRMMLYNRLFSIYPDQKYKTICKKIKKRAFLEQLKLIFLLDYDKTNKSMFLITVCYLFRLYSLILSVLFVLCEMPNLNVDVMHSCWIAVIVVTGYVWIRNVQRRNK